MKEIGVVWWKLPHVKCLANIFAKFSPSENNHVYIIKHYCSGVTKKSSKLDVKLTKSASRLAHSQWTIITEDSIYSPLLDMWCQMEFIMENMNIKTMLPGTTKASCNQYVEIDNSFRCNMLQTISQHERWSSKQKLQETWTSAEPWSPK